ncbi:MAG: hypothetical protein WCX70_01965 [Candidatus Paceibacterota bacterium]|jgi:sucrose-6-phosphate hydrolase SacC (GH32 family)
MTPQTKTTIFAFILFFIFIFIAWSFYPRQNQPTDFSSCVSAGFPVLESFPRQCQTEMGKIFTEDLSQFEKILTNASTSINFTSTSTQQATSSETKTFINTTFDEL